MENPVGSQAGRDTVQPEAEQHPITFAEGQGRLAGIEFHSDGLARFLVNHDRVSITCRMLQTTNPDG